MGFLVSLSGLDGSGKTTQGKRLLERCRENGIEAHYIHLKTIDTKNSYRSVAREAKKYITENKVKEKDEIRNIISAFLFLDKVKNEVEPALSSYKVVIVDRYLESAKCYHFLEGGFFPNVLKIYEQIDAPDINVFLNLDINECCRRVNERQEKTKYENKESFMKGYEFYKSQKDKFVWIDANRGQDIISDEIFELIKKKIGEEA